MVNACLPYHFRKPPMSFLRGQVGRQESIGGGSKCENHKRTASPGIDSKPLPTSQPRDDIPDEACLNHSKCQPPMSFPPASHVIPTRACGEEGIYGRRFKKQKPYCAASPGDPMPLPTSQRRDDIPVEACFNLGSSESPMSLQPASYVIPTRASG